MSCSNATRVLLSPSALSSLSPRPLLSAVTVRGSRFGAHQSSRAVAEHSARSYATQHQSSKSSSTTSRRRSVTPFNDDGHVPWRDLSAGEKTGRAAQQTFNFGLVIVGIVLTSGVAYVLFTDVFSTDSKVAHFNRAVDRIRADQRCTDLLGDGKEISAYGQDTYSKWRRARPIASSIQTDPQGLEHLLINFHVQGPRATGTVHIHMVRVKGANADFVYRYFYLDVPGQDRVYLENARGSDLPSGDKKTTLFGIKWT